MLKNVKEGTVLIMYYVSEASDHVTIGQNRWTHPGIFDRYAYINSRVAKVLRQKYKGNGADLAEVV